MLRKKCKIYRKSVNLREKRIDFTVKRANFIEKRLNFIEKSVQIKKKGIAFIAFIKMLITDIITHVCVKFYYSWCMGCGEQLIRRRLRILVTYSPTYF